MSILRAGPGGPLGHLTRLLDHVTGAPPAPASAGPPPGDDVLLCWPYLARVPGGARAVRRDRGRAA